MTLFDTKLPNEHLGAAADQPLPVSEALDLNGQTTGVEVDGAPATDSEKIAEPFDPEAIDVVTKCPPSAPMRQIEGSV